MQRFFCHSSRISADSAIIADPAQVHHMKDVLRLKEGSGITVFDERGNSYSCVIERLSGEVVLKIKKKLTVLSKNQRCMVTIACAVPKRSKMDEIVDKLTQLGVDRIIPLETKRGIVKFDARKRALRTSRWEKIALSASQQSQRATVPTVESICKIDTVLATSGDFDLKLILTLYGKRKLLKEAAANFHPQNVLVLIGPEGDFTPDEVNRATWAGFIPVSIGDLVLRVETAAVAIASFFRLFSFPAERSYENG